MTAASPTITYRPLGAIFGSSRSGTTWLGSILASHPEVAYRFEPFTRRRDGSALDLGSEGDWNLSKDDVGRLYSSLLRGDPLVEKPPFFPKSYLRLPPAMRGVLWAASRKTWRRPFTAMNQAPQGATVIFKEVEHHELMRALLDVGDVQVMYTLRHPCGVAWSRHRGHTMSLMPDRRNYLERMLPDASDDLRHKFEGRVAELRDMEAEALLWLLDVEPAFVAAAQSPNAKIVFYENLCRRPLEVARDVYAHFGLELAAATERFLADSTAAPSRWARFRYGELPIGSYFSVFREATSGAVGWRAEMPADAIEDVLTTVADSAAYRAGVACADWR